MEKLGGTPLLGLLSGRRGMMIILIGFFLKLVIIDGLCSGFYWNITDYEKGFAGGFDSWTLQVCFSENPSD